MQPPWQSDYSSPNVFVLLYLLHTGPRFFSPLFTDERFAVQVCSFSGGSAATRSHLFVPRSGCVKKKTPILFFDTALKVLLPRGGWVCLSKGFCGFFESFAKLIITEIFSVITSIHFGCFGSGFQTLCKNISKQKSCQQGRF